MECDSEDSHAQDRIPMSETFKRVLEQLNLNSSSDDHLTNLDCLDGVTRLKRRGSKVMKMQVSYVCLQLQVDGELVFV